MPGIFHVPGGALDDAPRTMLVVGIGRDRSAIGIVVRRPASNLGVNWTHAGINGPLIWKELSLFYCDSIRICSIL